MQTIQDLQDKLFFECKNILDSVSKISSHDELLRKHDLITELNDRMNVLKYLDKNKNSFSAPVVAEAPISLPEKDEFLDEKPENSFEEEIEEEVIFNNELNEIDPNENLNQENSEELVEEFELVDEYAIDDEEVVVEAIEEKEIPMSIVNEVEEKEVEEEVYAEHVVEQEEEFREEIDEVLEKSENLHVKENGIEEKEIEIQEPVLEFLKEEPQEVVEVKGDVEDETTEEFTENQEKKFKLSNIKGMKAVQSLFDEDPLEEMIEEEKKHEAESGNILKSNVSTDFMEAKPRQEFRLDLNDKIAFSKVLFDGSQSDLNDAIRNLNNCKNMEEAKEYLSDLYYARNWKKSDDVAQRLWTLVENKFH